MQSDQRGRAYRPGARVPAYLCFLISGLVVLGSADAAVGPATATKKKPPQIAVTIMVGGTANGHVTGSSGSNSVDCVTGLTCTLLVPAGQSVTLTATSDTDSSFVGWGGDCASSGAAKTCTLTVSTAKSVSATFGPLTPPTPTVPASFALTVTKLGAGTGRVDGGGLDCGTTCTASVPDGGTVTLVAVADPGSIFAGWGGACTGTEACVLTPSGPVAVTATFDRGVLAVTALAATSSPGHLARLRFKVTDSSGESREQVTVLRGRQVLARIQKGVARVRGGYTYGVSWLVPRALVKGVLRFCVLATDPVSRKTGTSCAALRIA
jgi:List-Bact-rpt repeat protein